MIGAQILRSAAHFPLVEAAGHFPSSFLWIKEGLLSVFASVTPVLLPVLLRLREVVPELAYLHREERGHSKIQPIPYDLCTHSN